jgi:hypothetical protein
MTKQEYEKRFSDNQQITGRGLDTTMHMPCPFCAAPEFWVYKIMEMQKVVREGAVCKECGRGMKAIEIKVNGGFGLEFIQTQGDPPPPYVPHVKFEHLGGAS